VPLLVLFDALKLLSNREDAQPRVLGFQNYAAFSNSLITAARSCAV
jgi:hypothetical protein